MEITLLENTLLEKTLLEEKNSFGKYALLGIHFLNKDYIEAQYWDLADL